MRLGIRNCEENCSPNPIFPPVSRQVYENEYQTKYTSSSSFLIYLDITPIHKGGAFVPLTIDDSANILHCYQKVGKIPEHILINPAAFDECRSAR